MKKTKCQNPVRASPRGNTPVPNAAADVDAILRHFAACRAAKEPLTRRLCEEDAYWEGRLQGKNTTYPPSAWLFNAVANKHADAMDAYPNPTVLPRESSDEQAAATLSAVLPVILSNCAFAETYSAAWWEKLKHGTAAYGVFWNPAASAGTQRGDVDVRMVDLRSLYWDPGVASLQHSRNLYLTCSQPIESVAAAYCPYAAGDPARDAWIQDVLVPLTDGGTPLTDVIPPPNALPNDGNVPITVIDRYYKTNSPNGMHLLQYMKIAGKKILYDSAADPAWAERGLYDHGTFPIVLDTLYPARNAPWGYGMIAVCRAPQDAVDALSANMIQTGMMATQKRFFASESTAVNEREFLDWTRPIVHVQGDISDARLKEITVQAPEPIYLQVLEGKIDELKQTVGNRDVNAGSAGSGVTSAAAIAALQEAGDKLSRDMIAAAYRTYEKILHLVIELVRQFYTEERIFRVTQKNGKADRETAGVTPPSYGEQGPRSCAMARGYDYVSVSKSTWSGSDRVPVFDLELKAERQSAATRNEQNALALELFRAGFFNPENAQAAEKALGMMDFPGKDAMLASAKSQNQ